MCLVFRVKALNRQYAIIVYEGVMALVESIYSPYRVSTYRLATKLLYGCLGLLLVGVIAIENSYAGDWTACEGPCNDIYTNVYATSPASGSSHDTGQTITFTTNVARDGVSSAGTYIPFQPEVSTSGGSGWSAVLVSPSEHCIYGSGSTGCDTLFQTYTNWPNSPDVDIVIDVTIGTGTTRVTVRLVNELGAFYTTPVFYFDVSASSGVRVTGLTDMSGTWNGSGDASNNDDVCVYSSGGSYDVTVSGPVDAGSYVLAEGGGTKIPITVYWNNTTGTTGRTSLSSAASPSLSGETGADSSSETCSGGSTANISWKALEADLQTKPAGTYTATETITVEVP